MSEVVSQQQNDAGQIFIKTLTGKSIAYDYDENKTIKQLKDYVEQLENIPADQQRLIYQGKQLEDNMTLGDYNITKDATVHLVLRLTG